MTGETPQDRMNITNICYLLKQYSEDREHVHFSYDQQLKKYLKSVENNGLQQAIREYKMLSYYEGRMDVLDLLDSYLRTSETIKMDNNNLKDAKQYFKLFEMAVRDAVKQCVGRYGRERDETNYEYRKGHASQISRLHHAYKVCKSSLKMEKINE